MKTQIALARLALTLITLARPITPNAAGPSRANADRTSPSRAAPDRTDPSHSDTDRVGPISY